MKRVIFYLMLGLLGLSGCLLGQARAYSQIVGSRWVYAPTDVTADFSPLKETIEFDQNKLTASNGCNDLEVDYRIVQNQIVYSDKWAVTLVTCRVEDSEGGPGVKIGPEYFDAVLSATAYHLEDGILFLETDLGPLRFEPASVR